MPERDLTVDVAFSRHMARFHNWDRVPHPEGAFLVLTVRDGDVVRLLRFEPAEARRLVEALKDVRTGAV